MAPPPAFGVKQDFAAGLPITFRRGFVREIRIHIPWLTLQSEPISVTIDTVELVASLHSPDAAAAAAAAGPGVLHPLSSVRLHGPSRGPSRASSPSVTKRSSPPGLVSACCSTRRCATREAMLLLSTALDISTRSTAGHSSHTDGCAGCDGPPAPPLPSARPVKTPNGWLKSYRL